jgi:hypothetical protein
MQALWMHQRIRNWPCTLNDTEFTVDLMNMVISGDMATACLALMYGTPDDMSEPYHWLNEERLNWLINNLKGFLGWP